MLKRILAIVLFISAMPLLAQTAAVTATVTDGDGQTWDSLNGYNATYSITLVSSAGVPVPQGQAYRIDTGATVTNTLSGNMSNVGALSVTLVSSNNITPSGTQWRFNVCPAVTSSPCLTVTQAVNASGSLSTVLSAAAVAPRIGGGVGNYAYADVEVSGIANNSYYNITTPALRCYAAAWSTCGGGGGGSVTTFSAGTLSPLFTTSVATATTTPALSFVLSPQTANTIFGAATTTPSWLPLPSCSGGANALIWTTGTGFGCNTISGGVTPSTQYQIAAFGAGGTSVAGQSITTDSTGNNLTLPAGLLSVANPGVFSNTVSSFPALSAVNGANCQTLFSVPQYNNYLTAAVAGCIYGPTNNPGTAYNQTTGGAFMAAAYGIGSGSGTSRAVGMYSEGICETGSTNAICYGANPLVEDFADSATGQQLIGMEIDVQPQKLPSAYSGNGSGVNALHIGGYNQAGTGGTFGPAINVGFQSYGTAAYFSTILNVNQNTLCPNISCDVLNVNAYTTTATSGTNYGGPVLADQYEAYWNGSGSSQESWRGPAATIANGTNPTSDSLVWIHNAGPAGQVHNFDLQNIQLELDGSTSGSAFISVSATGGTLNLGSANATVDTSGNMTVASCTGCGANFSGGVLGSVPYQSAPNTTVLAGPNITTNIECWTEQGTGSAGQAPTWGSCAGSAATAFSAVTGSTNTGQALVIGSSSSLTTSGTGTNVATSMSVFQGASYAGTATGAVNVLAATLSPAPAALSNLLGVPVTVLANLANTTTNPTIALNSLTAETIVKCNATALAAGDYNTTTPMQLQWNGTNEVLLNPQVGICQTSTAGNLTLGGSLNVNTVNAEAITTSLSVVGGQNGSSASATGGLTISTGNNTGTGGTGNVVIKPGAPASGANGFLQIQQSFTIAAATTVGYVMQMTATADRVVVAALGSTDNVGVATTVGGTAAQIYVQNEGKVLTVFDGTPVVGDLACAPPATTGTIGLAHDNVLVACPAGQKLGVITGQVSGTGSGATATVLLQLGS